tara:strand:- start:56 stop:451 length:396 start_codon:yes stop_codon:yes gene_type:complete
MKISEILTELGIQDWDLYGNPTTEEEFNSMFKKVTGVDENDISIQSSDPNDFGVTWSQIQEKKTELEGNKKLEWDVVRRERNTRIAKTDWTQLSDVPEETRTAWQTYRQALRDVTNQSDPSNITWPTEPSN